jgi:hypothetical protein
MLNHLFERLSVTRNVPPIAFVDDDLSIETHRNLNRAKDSQRGLTENFVFGFQKRNTRAKKWRESNRESIKEWRAKNHDRILNWQREWKRKNPDKVNAGVKRYREKNRKKYNAYQLQWLNKNREKRREAQNARHAERYQNEPDYKERKKQRNREQYHKAKQKIIDEIGLDGWKLLEKQKREKKHDKNSKSA